jgi:hypothetical protein
MYFLVILLLQCFILDLGRTFWRTIYFFRVALPEIEKTATYIQHAASHFTPLQQGGLLLDPRARKK